MAEKLNRIAEWRKKRGLSQQALAEKLGTHWVTVSKLERGAQRLTYEWMQRLASALDVSVQDTIIGDRPIATVQIGGVVEDSGQISDYEGDQLDRRNVYSSIFDEVYNDWYEILGDGLWPYFHKGDLIGCTRTNRPSEEFIGRFCLFDEENGNYWVGILNHGSREGYYNLHVGAGKPLKDLRGRVFSYVAHAIFELPERPIINKASQEDLRQAYEEHEKEWRSKIPAPPKNDK
ncbi:helix-turn-helix domain-containing protein [Lichenihabitans sp. PAMC28606]|uniref:helix-turn-helix domain-containing protein n=1 Tax=Lichenihabitans sp. PAMC28606 TaxID=2880932 RepID=UPI001D0A849B|nr:helix-turn-helix transcriptional regulator [Lichenihabitans sp. PAMC28606]UDL95476.1 helix-turn-helix domain-containing protein [Lichenihabitans sp. PAMC28606]